MQSLSISSTGLFPADSEYHLSSIDEYQDKAKQRLEGYKNKYGAVPDTFSSFLFREITTPPIAMLMDFISPRPFLHHTLKDNRKRIVVFEQKFEEKIPIKEFHPDGFYPQNNNQRQRTRDFFLEGVGFGSCLPELTEIMNTSNYRRISRSMVEGFRGNEDYISSKPDILNFNGQEDALLRYLAIWTYLTCPELLEPLAINFYHLDSKGYRIYLGSEGPFYRNWAETSYFLDVITRFGQSLSV